MRLTRCAQGISLLVILLFACAFILDDLAILLAGSTLLAGLFGLWYSFDRRFRQAVASVSVARSLERAAGEQYRQVIEDECACKQQDDQQGNALSAPFQPHNSEHLSFCQDLVQHLPRRDPLELRLAGEEDPVGEHCRSNLLDIIGQDVRTVPDRCHGLAPPHEGN